MSSSLYWKPVGEGNALPDELKRAVRKRWARGAGAGAVHELVDHTNLPYLEGLHDAEVEGAAELIAAIRKHGTVELGEEW